MYQSTRTDRNGGLNQGLAQAANLYSDQMAASALTNATSDERAEYGASPHKNAENPPAWKRGDLVQDAKSKELTLILAFDGTHTAYLNQNGTFGRFVGAGSDGEHAKRVHSTKLPIGFSGWDQLEEDYNNGKYAETFKLPD